MSLRGKRRDPVPSLRSRLFVLIVVPLLLVAALSSLVLHGLAQNMARNLYDDTLKVVAHAVAREVVVTRGNLIADALMRSLEGAVGDPLHYQVLAAGGFYVVGHTDAPPLPEGLTIAPGSPVFYDSTYRGAAVRVVILREFITDPELAGWTTVRVWQTVTRRQALSLQLLGQSAAVLALLVLAAAALVWFGINRGLSPLTNLRAAVAQRNAGDLGPIRRRVPREVEPLVATINSLFQRLSAELERRNAFISNAAHQLRNPVASIQALAESAQAARGDEDQRQRLGDLHESARRLSRLSQQLLRFDAAMVGGGGESGPAVDFRQVVAEVARRHVPRALQAGVELALDDSDAALPVAANRVLLEEAVDNLIDNALKYAAAPGNEVVLSLTREKGQAVLRVADQGPGVPEEMREQVFGRFVRLSTADDGGCGLGLPIVRAIAGRAGGAVLIEPSARGCVIRLALPLAEDA